MPITHINCFHIKIREDSLYSISQCFFIAILHFCCLQLAFKNGTKHFKVIHLRDKFQRITLLRLCFECLGILK